ncbi:MAG TPA: MBL fold metallo-hydrolase [Polyangiaceae bacterium]|nr:MBL fold metallo-hydrolase [Polyangiaceae bacterium]
MRRVLPCLLLSLVIPGCVIPRIISRNFAAGAPKRLEHRIDNPVRRDARLAVLWVGHATVLIQMDDRFILTDPVFTDSVGGLSPRLVEPGLDAAKLPEHVVVAISHAHYDHLSFDSLDSIEGKVDVLLLPPQAKRIIPHYRFETRELERWHSYQTGGLRVTAVPVKHVGGRWGMDAAWNNRSYAGYVFQYHGLAVYFGGDSAFSAVDFDATRERFPTLDLALLPICPAEPRDFMRHTHMDPAEALDAFEILRARRMVPIHFDTFINGDDRPGDCSLRLLSEMARRGIEANTVDILRIGEQRVLIGK